MQSFMTFFVSNLPPRMVTRSLSAGPILNVFCLHLESFQSASLLGSLTPWLTWKSINTRQQTSRAISAQSNGQRKPHPEVDTPASTSGYPLRGRWVVTRPRLPSWWVWVRMWVWRCTIPRLIRTTPRGAWFPPRLASHTQSSRQDTVSASALLCPPYKCWAFLEKANHAAILCSRAMASHAKHPFPSANSSK